MSASEALLIVVMLVAVSLPWLAFAALFVVARRRERVLAPRARAVSNVLRRVAVSLVIACVVFLVVYGAVVFPSLMRAVARVPAADRATMLSAGISEMMNVVAPMVLAGLLVPCMLLGAGLLVVGRRG